MVSTCQGEFKRALLPRTGRTAVDQETRRSLGAVPALPEPSRPSAQLSLCREPSRQIARSMKGSRPAPVCCLSLSPGAGQPFPDGTAIPFPLQQHRLSMGNRVAGYDGREFGIDTWHIRSSWGSPYARGQAVPNVTAQSVCVINWPDS